MKASLVVASGVHKGKVIVLPETPFTIGRDPDCQLRPASPSISKKHCKFFTRDKQLWVIDFGSTNGTIVNDESLPANAETQLNHGDNVKVGPLDFGIVIAGHADMTPIPQALKTAAGTSKEVQKLVKAADEAMEKAPAPKLKSPSSSESDAEGDEAAAMLLAMGDDEDDLNSDVPEGSTVMEMPAMGDMSMPMGQQPKPPEDKKAPVGSSDAANDLLRRYLRRSGK